MQTQDRLLSDFARVTSGAIGLLAGLRGEIEAAVRQQIQRLLGNMALVDREEFEAVREMAAKARDEQEAMAARIAVLEARLAGTSKPRRAASRPRARAKPTPEPRE